MGDSGQRQRAAEQQEQAETAVNARRAPQQVTWHLGIVWVTAWGELGGDGRWKRQRRDDIHFPGCGEQLLVLRFIRPMPAHSL